MKQIDLKIQKWLIAYVVISLLLWVYLWDFNYRRRETLELILVTHLWVVLVFFIETFFFYMKITGKSIWWCILTTGYISTFGFFIALVLGHFIFLFWENLRGYLIEYFIFGLSITLSNILCMFSESYLEQNKTYRSDILDDKEF